MLLLTSVFFGRAQADEAFGFLPEEEAELLKHRFEAFQSIPKEQRILFSRYEMRRMLSARRRRLATAEPKQLAGLLAKEKPVVAEVVLRVLPSLLAHAVQAALPGFRKPPVHKEPRAEVFSVVRWKLEEKLQNVAVHARFQFGDLLSLQVRELITLADRMGARVFATALAGLPGAERQHFLEALPPDQRMLAQKACEAAKERPLQAKDARRLLELHHAAQSPSVALRSAGIQRIVRACLAQSAEFASKMARRYEEGELGKLFARWIEEEKRKQMRAKAPPGDGGRADILEQLEFLAKRNFLERPLVLPQSVPVSKAPVKASAASGPGMGSARLAGPLALKPSPLGSEKLAKPTPSKLLHPGSRSGNVARLPRLPESRLPPRPRPADFPTASSKPRGGERLSSPPSSRAVGGERPSSLPSSLPSTLPSTPPASRGGRPPVQGPGGKGPTPRGPTLEKTVVRKRLPGDAQAPGREGNPTERRQSMGAKPARKG